MDILFGLLGAAIDKGAGSLGRLDHLLGDVIDSVFAYRFVCIVARIPGDDNVQDSFWEKRTRHTLPLFTVDICTITAIN